MAPEPTTHGPSSGRRSGDGYISRHHVAAGASYVVLVASLILLLFPVAWMLATAFKTQADVFAMPPRWIPAEFTWAPLRYAISGTMVRFFLNSVVVAAMTAAVTTCIGAMAAYVISRGRHWSTDALLLFFLASMSFPIPLLMISLYSTLSLLGLLDTYGAVTLGHVLLTLPIVVWLLKGFVDGLPVEVEESAYMDGAGLFRIIASILVPMMKPGFTAAAIYTFVTSWNEFIFGLTFTSTTEMRPLPAGISLLFLQEFQYQWPEMMAVATVATVPILVLFLIFQRNFVEGVTAGAVKS